MSPPLPLSAWFPFPVGFSLLCLAVSSDSGHSSVTSPLLFLLLKQKINTCDQHCSHTLCSCFQASLLQNHFCLISQQGLFSILKAVGRFCRRGLSVPFRKVSHCSAQHTAAMHSVQQHGHQGTSCPCTAHLPLTQAARSGALICKSHQHVETMQLS